MPPNRERDPAGDLRMGLGWRAFRPITFSRLLRVSGLPWLARPLSHLAGKDKISLPASLRQTSRPVGWSRGGIRHPGSRLRPEILVREVEVEIVLMIIIAAVIALYAGWHIAFLVRNFGTKEARRAYEATH